MKEEEEIEEEFESEDIGNNEIQIKDLFGTELKVGHVVCISKGTRGMRNFDYGIVTKIHSVNSVANSIMITTAIAVKKLWNLVNPHVPVLFKNNHRLDQGINKNLVIVLDVASRSELIDNLIDAIPLLISAGDLPETYLIGQDVGVSKLINNSKKSFFKEIEEPEFLSILEPPQSIKVKNV